MYSSTVLGKDIELVTYNIVGKAQANLTIDGYFIGLTQTIAVEDFCDKLENGGKFSQYGQSIDVIKTEMYTRLLIYDQSADSTYPHVIRETTRESMVEELHVVINAAKKVRQKS